MNIAAAVAALFLFASAPPAAAEGNLTVGSKIIPFDDVDIDGKPLSFPTDWKGKIVLLDFWATWCGPCMAEAPNVAAVYAKYKDKGFDVLGVSLDYAGKLDRVRSVTKDKKMAWREIYDGKGWSARIAELYGINSIPSAFLVDGDTGLILAMDDELRGAGLERALKKYLK